MSFLFNMSIPGDTGFLEPLLELATKVAGYAGYQARDAEQIASTIREGAAEAIRLTSAAPVPIEILFRTQAERFEVTLSYEHAAPDRPVPARPVNGFVCNREGHLNICRLSKDLPSIETGS